MKNSTRIGRNASSTNSKPQLQTSREIPAADRNGHATKRADWWNTKPKEWTAEHLQAYRNMRECKLREGIELCGPGIFFPALSEAQALDFISLVVADHETALRQIAGAALASQTHDEFWAVQLSESIVAARAAARRARWDGLKSAPSHDEESEGKKREPLLLDLSGITGTIAFDDSALLEHIGGAMYEFRKEILREIRPKLCGDKEADLLTALRLAELVVDRAASLEEVEQAEARNQRTELQEMAWKSKTSRVACG